jgi:AhpD family alkylhydroperoxidase|tara:strand:- start:305 stop:727 length:423 start_codon:yes stop_codon:yes gene_type:complete
MKKLFILSIFVLGFNSMYAQDKVSAVEKSEIIAKSPFNSLYPTSILKSSDEYFGAAMGLYSQGVVDEKSAHLIALGTASATKCLYCIPFHLSELKRLGASEEEMKTAVLIAADIMRMSTLFYGNEFDLEAFKAMLNQEKP